MSHGEQHEDGVPSVVFERAPLFRDTSKSGSSSAAGGTVGAVRRLEGVQHQEDHNGAEELRRAAGGNVETFQASVGPGFMSDAGTRHRAVSALCDPGAVLVMPPVTTLAAVHGTPASDALARIFVEDGGDVGAAYLRMNTASIASVVWQRASVLVSLLLLQSVSQFILEVYEGLISAHVIIPLFLTMLVGAGGNAGNQATVRAITGLVTGEFSAHDFLKLLRKELAVGIVNATILAGICFARVYYFYGSHNLFYSTMAITASLFTIVVSSVVLGTAFPFLFGAIGLNREHAAPVIQVVMDITGVFITCALCSLIIPDSEHRSSARGGVG